MKLLAYAQALKGDEINFSFAEHRSSVVVYKKPRYHPFTAALEWEPRRFSARDLEYFDYILVGGIEEEQARLQRIPSLKLVQPKGLWRLYRILHNSPN